MEGNREIIGIIGGLDPRIKLPMTGRDGVIKVYSNGEKELHTYIPYYNLLGILQYRLEIKKLNE